MLPILNFYGNHALDFDNNEFNNLEYYAISELRNLPIPELVLQVVYDSLCLQFPGDDLFPFINIKNWGRMSFPNISGMREIPIENIVSLGPLGMRAVFAPEHIILPPIIYDRVAWYSPINRDKIQAIRSFYFTIINHFGGDHALYVDERIINKFNFPSSKSDNSTLNLFEQSLITRYGKTKKTIYDYSHDKYPKYYIDNFEDMQN